MGKRWLHLDKETHDIAIGKCRHRHGLQKRGSLSVVFNLAGTECLIKVAGANKTWRKKQSWMKDVIGIYDHSDHYKAIALVKGPLWEAVDVADAGDGR